MIYRRMENGIFEWLASVLRIPHVLGLSVDSELPGNLDSG